MQKEALTVAQFCEAHSISRTSFYQLQKDGIAPATFRVGRRVLISKEAAAEWRAAMEAKSAA